MKSNNDFSVSGFKQRNHRKVMDKKQVFYVETVKDKIMEPKFKNSLEIRNYWEEKKREERARAKEKAE